MTIFWYFWGLVLGVTSQVCIDGRGTTALTFGRLRPFSSGAVLPLCCEGDGVLAGPPQHPLRHHALRGHGPHAGAPRCILHPWWGMVRPGLDKIKTFRDRSWNFSKLFMKVRKLQQQNLQKKSVKSLKFGKWHQTYLVFGIEILISVRIIQMVSNNMFVSLSIKK